MEDVSVKWRLVCIMQRKKGVPNLYSSENTIPAMTDMMIMFQTSGQYNQMDSRSMDGATEEPKRQLLIQNEL